jgi:uncharacterized protein (DUF934 family)
MVLVKDGVQVDDLWKSADDGEDLPDGPAIVTLARWRSERDRLDARNAPLGIRLESDASVADIAADLGRFSLVALEFPVFTDGRPFSMARQLRDRYGFEGEIRAVGDVLRDQILFMVRCGFDAFEMQGEDGAKDWRAAMSEFGVFYQPGADRRPNVLQRRHI